MRERLAQGGLLVAPAGETNRAHVRVEAEGLQDFAAYRALRETLIEGRRACARRSRSSSSRAGSCSTWMGRSAGDALLAALKRAAPPGLTLTALETSPERLRLRVDLAAEPTPASPPGARAIDTSNPNRY